MNEDVLIIEVRDGIPMRIMLPFTAWRRGCIEDELKPLTAFVKREDMDRFRSKLNWLPTTDVELRAAQTLHRAGVNWHDACAKALGHPSCGCPECKLREHCHDVR